MLDIGVTKIAVVGAIALVVIGPERLPALARTLGTLLGRAQRYVADVKAEVNRSMELDELRKMKDTVTAAASEVEKSIQSTSADLDKTWSDVNQALLGSTAASEPSPSYPIYKHPAKRWRAKRAAVPGWFKARTGMRTHTQSGAARVARFRPPRV